MVEEAFRFDAGRISLDLMATLGNRCGERLPDQEALEAWLIAARLLDGPARVSSRDLDRTRRLRGALFGLIEAELTGGLPPGEDVQTINEVAATPARAPRLVVDAGVLGADRPRPDVPEALGMIARDAIELSTGPQRALLRECAADDCSGIYVDASRGRRRRWCSARTCGNRARVAAHRVRRQSKSSSSG